MSRNIQGTPICDCCGRVARDKDGQVLHRMHKVYLGDSAHTVEDWCWWCYDSTFPQAWQKKAQAGYVAQVERFGYAVI